MKTRCKFRCDEVSKTKNWTNDPKKPFIFSVKMNAVSGGTEENKSFWAATPGGQIQFSSIVEPSFEPGKEYYIDISEAE